MPARLGHTPLPRSRRPDRARLKRRAEVGEWLLVQEVADLFGISRATVDRMIRDGLITVGPGAGPGVGPEPGGGLRRCDPATVLAELDRRRP